MDIQTKSVHSESSVKYLRLLSQKYPTIQDVSAEIIKNEALLKLPKGTEHFLSDLHGEYEAFAHILKNASGAIKLKIDQIFGNNVSDKERKSLATLIYYPDEKLSLIRKQNENTDDWYRITLYRLIEISRLVVSKYTRQKVRKALPTGYDTIIEELLYANSANQNQEQYYEQTIKSIISADRADAFITAFANLIQSHIIYKLHIIGDIFDRGPGAHIILDRLMNYHSLDIEWGNHDVLWMGAAAGQEACIAAALTNTIKYNNFEAVEDGYGINLRPLLAFAMEVYGSDEAKPFYPKNVSPKHAKTGQTALTAQIHKAIAVIQFKLEGQTILQHPEYQMEHRLTFSNVNFEQGTVTVDGTVYPLTDTFFPTVDPKNPYALTAEETALVEKLRSSFLHSEKLQTHVQFLFKKGGMYLTYNSNLLYHGCIPMNKDGSFTAMTFDGRTLSGKAYLDYAETLARKGYFSKEGSKEKRYGMDFMWYLWCGPKSPLCGKNKIATFERYFIQDKTAWREIKDPYYTFINDEDAVMRILREFDTDETIGKIVNGHMPVKIKRGESPVKANGRLLVIDGGLSKAYQPVTGIAGYTLISSSNEMFISAHEPFVSAQHAINTEADIYSTPTIIELYAKRILVGDTDQSASIKEEIADLTMLLDAYRTGTVKQRG